MHPFSRHSQPSSQPVETALRYVMRFVDVNGHELTEYIPQQANAVTRLPRPVHYAPKPHITLPLVAFMPVSVTVQPLDDTALRMCVSFVDSQERPKQRCFFTEPWRAQLHQAWAVPQDFPYFRLSRRFSFECQPDQPGSLDFLDLCLLSRNNSYCARSTVARHSHWSPALWRYDFFCKKKILFSNAESASLLLCLAL